MRHLRYNLCMLICAIGGSVVPQYIVEVVYMLSTRFPEIGIVVMSL